MKTPLNELLDWIKEFEDKPVPPTLTNMKEKIWQLLPKEEEQLEDAFWRGFKSTEHYESISITQNKNE